MDGDLRTHVEEVEEVGIYLEQWVRGSVGWRGDNPAVHMSGWLIFHPQVF